MKKIFISTMLLFSISINANEKVVNNSITLMNLSDTSKLIEVNTKGYKIEVNSSLRISCVENELVGILDGEKFENILCGTNKELN